MSKVAIIGSRNFNNRNSVYKYVRNLPKDTEVVSGGARGVDSWAIEEAQRCGLKTKVFPADWDTFGKSAGMRRNHTIRQYVDRIVAFSDGESKGTQNMIDQAIKSKQTLVVIYE